MRNWSTYVHMLKLLQTAQSTNKCMKETFNVPNVVTRLKLGLRIFTIQVIAMIKYT